MTLFWTKAWDAVAGVFFPTPCVSCGVLIAANDPPLCPSCWDRLPLIGGVTCGCGAPLPEAAPPHLECGRCRRGRSPITSGASLGFHEGTLRDAVVALKYQGRHKTAERLCLRLFTRPSCREILKDADFLIAVPLHEERLKERGFNQAVLLAAGLSRLAGVEASANLVRVRNTPSQTELSARDRRRNVADAFAVKNGPALADSVVVLVDDVATTGATLRECARTLLTVGVREVRAITVARAE